jgi:hypothetical protein
MQKIHIDLKKPKDGTSKNEINGKHNYKILTCTKKQAKKNLKQQ